MNRQDALNIIWRKLLIIFASLLALSVALSVMAGPFTVPILTFIVENIGGYVGPHKNLSTLTDQEV